MIDQQRNSDVKLVLHFFNLKDGVIHATDKTEIEVDDEVNINLYIYITYYTLLINYYLLNNNITPLKGIPDVQENDWESMLYSRLEDYETLPLLPSNTRVSVEGIVDGVSKGKKINKNNKY